MDRRNLIKSLGALLALPALAKTKEVKTNQLLLQSSPVAGFQYYQGEALWSEFRNGQALTLLREAENPYDERAVAIYWNKAKLGYIPRRDNAAISQLLDRGERLKAVIEKLDDTDDYWKLMTVAVSVT